MSDRTPAERKPNAAPKRRRVWLPRRFDFMHDGQKHLIEIDARGRVYVCATKNGGTVRKASPELRKAVLDAIERQRREAEERAAAERRKALGIHAPTNEEVVAVAPTKR